VSGKVLDNKGEPLAGASVIVEGTTIGTVTDMDGNYTITIPHNASQLSYSYVGFITQTLPITNNIMHVTLEENTLALDEVVVVGYGTKKSGLSNMLQGKLAGIAADKSSIKI